ncbi:MAG: GTP cyclohydrolase FolE2, partial [Burkholderiales bacterium]
MNQFEGLPIADVQNSPDTRHKEIDRVGIKSIRHPARVADKGGGVQHTIANFNMYVRLPHRFKGTHMSRFVEILTGQDNEISVESFEPMLRRMVQRLEAEAGHIEMSFPYFINKAAPVSGVKSLMDYDVTFIGEITQGGKYQFTMRVVVPVTSLCPCSKKISDYGAHNQRSHVTVTAVTNDFVWIEELVGVVEKHASSELFGLLKRPDEKYVTERAY